MIGWLCVRQKLGAGWEKIAPYQIKEVQSNLAVSILQDIPPLVDPQGIQLFVYLFERLQPISQSETKEDEEDEIADNEEYEETDDDDADDDDAMKIWKSITSS